MADSNIKGCFMDWKGSYTVEAAAVMGIFCFLAVGLIHQIYQMHDRTAGMMILHQTVEKMGNDGQKKRETERTFSAGIVNVFLETDGEIVSGTAESTVQRTVWRGQIETEIFRPERFLRRIEAVKQLGDRNGS